MKYLYLGICFVIVCDSGFFFIFGKTTWGIIYLLGAAWVLMIAIAEEMVERKNQ